MFKDDLYHTDLPLEHDLEGANERIAFLEGILRSILRYSTRGSEVSILSPITRVRYLVADVVCSERYYPELWQWLDEPAQSML